MSLSWDAIRRIAWTGLFAVVFTAVISDVWGALLFTNLRVSPALPWSAIAHALVLAGVWTFLDGSWGPVGSRPARRALLRAREVPTEVLSLAIIAGLLGIAALAGLWIVLHRLAVTPTNPLPDFSRYPALTVGAALVTASISGGVSEEAGFRGYFQGALEGAGLGWAAVVIPALVMAPEHALTQGFVWPNLLFYLLVDVMLGSLAYLTGSILPGIVVHAVGLLAFFTLVWPHDARRALHGLVGGTDVELWLAIVQTAVFGVLSLGALVWLARTARSARTANNRVRP
jgi:membrane protease YdiL (CAAX protease family)